MIPPWYSLVLNCLLLPPFKAKVLGENIVCSHYLWAKFNKWYVILKVKLSPIYLTRYNDITGYLNIVNGCRMWYISTRWHYFLWFIFEQVPIYVTGRGVGCILYTPNRSYSMQCILIYKPIDSSQWFLHSINRSSLSLLLNP